MEIQTPAPILMKFCTHIPTWFDPPTTPSSLGPETPRDEGQIFEKCLQNKRFLASCKLTRAAPGTSATWV